jgi:hypothetical protein
MVVFWAATGVLSNGKTKNNAAIANLNSLECSDLAAKTERIKRSDAVMAQAIPFPHKPVSIIQVHASAAALHRFPTLPASLYWQANNRIFPPRRHYFFDKEASMRTSEYR